MTSSKTTHPAIYRAAQFFSAVKASLPVWAGGIRDNLSSDDQTLVKSILLTLPQQQLFARMPPNDQRHAIAVVRTLRQTGYNHPALMQAALLHDAGKSMSQPIIHRVLIVLFEAFWPTALQWLSSAKVLTSGNKSAPENSHSLFAIDNSQFTINPISWWRRPFVVHAQHPAIGATWAYEVGCDPLAVSLIARHQDALDNESTEENGLLAALQWADDMN